MAMAPYPGSGSLPAEVRDRILSTFQHTLKLYKQKRIEEVLLGCDFLLKLDPLFDPARKLLEITRNPNAPVDLTELEEIAASSDELKPAREALQARDFQQALDVASEALSNDPTNEEAQGIADEARERLEAAPFVEQFLNTARAHLQKGNQSLASTALEKAKVLDATHQEVLALDREIASSKDARPEAEPFDFAPPSYELGFSSPIDSSSFVVDASPAPDSDARTSGAPAADFGFAFEEEPKPPSASMFDATPTDSAMHGFDPTERPSAFAPEAAPPNVSVGEAQTFDFTTAAVEVSDGDRTNIQKYLAEGDRAYAAEEYQKAIDLWSRIFLIDVTNDEASERIERARARRLETDAKIEELLIAGAQAADQNDTVTARAKFEEAIKLDPTHHDANENLRKLQFPGEAAAVSATPSSRPPAPSSRQHDIFDDDFDTIAPAAAPATSLPKASSKQPASAPKPQLEERGGLRKFAVPLALLLALVAAGAGGWWVYSRYLNQAPEHDRSATEALFGKAQAMVRQRNYDQAIALLLTVPGTDPAHDRVLDMIVDIKNQKAQSAGNIGGRPAAEVRAEYLSAGEEAFVAHDYIGAKTAFEKASAIQALPPSVQAMHEEAVRQVAKLDTAMGMLKEGRFAESLVVLNSLAQQDPQNQSIRLLISHAHFDLGVEALQKERMDEAITQFDQVLQQNPNDDIARRSRDLAARYSQQPTDLLYKIYVKYLEPR